MKFNLFLGRALAMGRQIGLVLALLAFAGCSLPRFNSSPPKAQVSAFQLSTNAPTSVSLEALQAQVMRFADTYVAIVAQACDDSSVSVTNTEVRLAMLQWKLGQATAAYTDATGKNPVINALDMLVLVTMARMVVEDYGVDTYGAAIRPLVDAQRNLETNAWTMASGVLTPSQVGDLHGMIQAWRAKNPRQRYIGPIRFREFAAALNQAPTRATSSTSIFSLLYLDPFAGLDPTAAAIEETRELAERAMYYTQHMPQLLSWQTQLLVYQVAVQPESKQILADANRLALSSEVFAQTAKQLPGLVNDQRQAAIQQVLDGLTAQGTQTRDLLGDARSTVDSVSAAATNLNTTIQSLTDFVRYVSPTNAEPAVPATNRRPFNVLDYGQAASQIGVAARDLNEALQTLNHSTPELATVSRQTAADANQVVDHAFRCGMYLILVLMAAVAATFISCRFFANLIESKKVGRTPPK